MTSSDTPEARPRATPFALPVVAESELNADHAASSALRPHLARSAVFGATMAFFAVIWLIGLTLSTLSAMSMIGVKTAVDLGPAIDSGMSILGLGGMVLVAVAWLVALMVPVREFVAGGGVLLPEAAGRQTSVRDDIQATLERRCPPFELDPDDLDDTPGLQLRNEHEWAMVVLRVIGPDLHVGWTVWRNRSSLSLIGGIMGDMVDGGRAGDGQLLRASSSSAMRELLRGAVEGAAGAAARSD
jgi:hypothetical protein